MSQIELSVIIPTRNRALYLQKALESISKQTFDSNKYEVIVNDNGSSDNTKEVVESFCGIIPNLVYYYDKTPGLHTGRHNGYKLSKGGILVYADDDIEAFPTWLEGVHESFEDRDVVLVGGKDLPKYESTVPFWILEKWYKQCEYGHCMGELSLIDFGDNIKEITPWYVFGCNFSVRKQIITETKGFHPDGMPFELIEYRGDGETFVSRYVHEKGYKTIYNPKASVYHIVTKDRLTLDYFKKRAFCQGVEMSYIDKHYKKKETTPQKGYKIRIYSRILKDRLKDIYGIQLLQDINLTEMDKEINKSRQIGYDYHDQMYRTHSEIREWVHKESYLE